ncbi:GntR family transcriptional regulator [Paraburkholderia tropica]|uniref:GntR family transcriptional regulator n=1 Tax=Paraburkholderia tropica TaxID=92647 RepID=UPI002AB04D0F|nr:GntR family transcriptional regulator [Paraburkholderia tropica]
MTPELTESQQKALRGIVAHVRRERLPEGTHIPEWTLAKLIGTSRSPVRVALEHLVNLGCMRYDRNRGYSVSASFEDFSGEVLEQMSSADDPAYMRMAESRFNGAIPDSVTEADLTRALDASRADVRKALLRAQNEGWVEKEAGYGWRFLPMIDSLEAYDDMYSLREAIEPACILSPKFRPDLNELRHLKQEQESILDGSRGPMSATERFEMNARLHEAIVSWSGNQFALQTVRRLDRLRRLAEYRQAPQRLPTADLAKEHLEILAAIERGDTLAAASLMKRHIDYARLKKAVSQVFDHAEAENRSP